MQLRPLILALMGLATLVFLIGVSVLYAAVGVTPATAILSNFLPCLYVFIFFALMVAYLRGSVVFATNTIQPLPLVFLVGLTLSILLFLILPNQTKLQVASILFNFPVLFLVLLSAAVIFIAREAERQQDRQPSSSGDPNRLTLGDHAGLSFFRAFQIPNPNRERGVWVLGLPGSGKSRALESWALQDMLAGHGCCFIDPHGDAFDHLLTRLATYAKDDKKLKNRLVVINPLDPKWSVGFNPLSSIEGMPSERVANFMTDVVLKIWNTEMGEAPRMVRLLTFTLQALVELHMTLLDVPRFLTRRDWRDELLTHAKNEGVQEYFTNELPKGDKEAQQWIAPVLNRLGELIFDPDIRVMFAQKTSLNWRAVLDHQAIVLVNLNKGRLGETSSWLLGAFLVAQIQKAALSRADSEKRERFYLYLDEFQNYTTENIADILAESRKYGLSLILAHQSVTQLDSKLKNAVMNTTGTLASFLVSHEDAKAISPDLLPAGSLVRAGWWGLGLRQQVLPSEELAGQLTRLEKRQFWLRMRGDRPPVKLQALPMPDPIITEEVARAKQKLLDYAGPRCGKLKADVRAELEKQGVMIKVPRPMVIADYEDEPANPTKPAKPVINDYE